MARAPKPQLTVFDVRYIVLPSPGLRTGILPVRTPISTTVSITWIEVRSPIPLMVGDLSTCQSRVWCYRGVAGVNLQIQHGLFGPHRSYAYVKLISQLPGSQPDDGYAYRVD